MTKEGKFDNLEIINVKKFFCSAKTHVEKMKDKLGENI